MGPSLRENCGTCLIIPHIHWPLASPFLLSMFKPISELISS